MSISLVKYGMNGDISSILAVSLLSDLVLNSSMIACHEPLEECWRSDDA